MNALFDFLSTVVNCATWLILVMSILLSWPQSRLRNVFAALYRLLRDRHASRSQPTSTTSSQGV